MTNSSRPRHLWTTGPLLCICLLCCLPWAGAQQNVIRTLQAELPAYGQDSLQYANTLNRISSLYLVQHLDSSRHYAEAARFLCERLKYPKGLADAYLNLGACFTFQNNNNLAYRFYMESLQRYRNLADSAGISLALANIGAYYHYQGQNQLSVPYLQEAVSIGSRLLRDSLWVPVLSSYYLVFSRDSLRQDSARWALHKAHDIATRYHDGRMITYTGLFLAHEKMQNGQLQQAMEDINELVQAAMPLGLTYLAVYGNAQLDLYASYAQMKDSVVYRERMLEAAISGGYKRLVMAPVTSLYRHYKKTDPAQAFHFADLMCEIGGQQQELRAKGELDYMESFIQEKETRALHLYNALKQQSLAAGQLEITNRNLIVLFFIVVVILLACLLVAFLRVQRKAVLRDKRYKEVNQLLLQKHRELQHHDDFKNKLLSILAHDFRLPLSQIINITDLFRRSDIPPEHFRDMAFSIASTANETLQLFETVLQWVKSQLTGFDYVPSTYHVKELLDEALEPLEADIRDKGILLEMEVEEELTVKADREMLQFVNRNLLHNAVKYSRRGSRVAITAVTRKERVLVTVTNEGTGIHAMDMPYIFNHRVPGKLVRETGRGAGLALIICKDFIEKMRGSITVRSDGENYATFEYEMES